MLAATAAALAVARPASGQMISGVTALRQTSDGSVVVSGKTTLTAGTRLLISIAPSDGIAAVQVDSKGAFTVRGLGAIGRPVTDTAFMVHVDGADGVDVNVQVTVAPIPPAVFAKRFAAWTQDSLAIAGRPIVDAVKGATIELPDGRKSSVPIRDAIRWNEWTGKFSPGEWAVQEPSPGNWIVSLSGREGGNHPVAHWSYNATSGEVHALDAAAIKLSYRNLPVLACVTEAEAANAKSAGARHYPPTARQLVILPLPAPAADANYKLEAVFLVDATGNAELFDWNRPSDPVWARKVAESLLGYKFRPAVGFDGTPSCGRAVIRVAPVRK